MANKTRLGLLVIIIVVIAIGVYVYQRSDKNVQNETSSINTAGWKTYSNPEFNYEIKYPASYTLSAKGEFDDPNSKYYTPDRSTIELFTSQVRIGVINDKNVAWINDECKNVTTKYPSMKLGDNVFNVNIYEDAVTDLGKPDRVYRNYYLRTSDACYLITTSYPPLLPQSQKDIYNSEIDTVVSTFKLI